MHICFCDGGLSNRLNTLLFGLILRKRYGHDWAVAWPCNNWCGAPFPTLFDCNVQALNDPLSHFKERENEFLFLLHENQAGFDPKRILFHPALGSFDAYRALLERHPQVLYMHNLIPDFVRVGDIADALADLRINQDIALQALDFCRTQHIDETVFGLHIRKTDFGSLVDDQALYTLVKNSPGRFFVCSDDADVTRRFGSLPNCTVFVKSSYPRKLDPSGGWNSWITDREGRHFPFNVDRPARAIREALVDLLILSRTQIVQVSQSTFFRMALLFRATNYLALQEHSL